MRRKKFEFKVEVLGASESREDLSTRPHFRFPASLRMGRHIMLALNKMKESSKMMS